MSNPLISVVSPEYGGAKIVSELVRRVKESVSKITEDFEIILVNDASPDNTWEEIEKECAKDKRVKGLDLSRNFGQHYAITAGLNYAKGEWVVVMDCDLQDIPEAIPELYKKAQEGWDIVQARRKNRKDRFLKRFYSKMFQNFVIWLTGKKYDQSIGNFGIFNKKVIAECNKMDEVARSFGSLINYVGFRKIVLDVEHSVRAEGKSSYTFRKSMNFAVDMIISCSNRPLRMAVGLGFLMSIVSFVLAIYNLLAKLFGIIQLGGYTTTVFSIWFVGGIVLMVMGVLGLYIGKIYDQVRKRQLYIVANSINIEK